MLSSVRLRIDLYNSMNRGWISGAEVVEKRGDDFLEKWRQ